MASIRKQLNLISSRGEAVYNKIYVDEFGVTYKGNKQGRLEKVQGSLAAAPTPPVIPPAQFTPTAIALSDLTDVNLTSPVVGDLLTYNGTEWVNLPSPSTSGVLFGTATQVSAGVYTTTIVGVTAYTAGSLYLIKFTTANDGDSTLNINGLGAKKIYKNTATPLSSGDIKANQEIEVIYDGTNFQAIGLVSTQLLAYVHNAQGSVLTKGQVVYAYQATGNKMSVKLARADADATSAKTIGLVYDSSIGIGADGYIIIQGVIEGINTGAYSAGDTLYLSGTTFGAATNVKPHAPIHLVYVGIVEKAIPGNGQIYVRCQNGYELDEIHDVDLISTPPVNNDILTYVTGTPNLWKPRSISTILGYTPQAALTLTTTGTTGPATLVGATLNIPQYSGATGVTSVGSTSPINSSGGTTPTISIDNAKADGSSAGAAAFDASDFNDNGSGVISIDYANGQKASNIQDGFLKSSDWAAFDAKQNALTIGNLTEATSSVLTISGGSGSVIGSGASIQVKKASGSQDGYLASSDFTTFSGKQNAITLTTTGTSGAATLVGSTLNIPQYSGGGTDSINWPHTEALPTIGSTIKAEPISATLSTLTSSTSVNPISQRLYLLGVWLSKASTITGVKWVQATQANFTASNFNGVALFTLSGGTFTRVAVSANDNTIWSTTGSNTVKSKAFTSTYSAAAGVYYVGLLYSSSAVVTAPAFIIKPNTIYNTYTLDNTNGVYFDMFTNSQSSMPSTLTIPGSFLQTNIPYAALY